MKKAFSELLTHIAIRKKLLMRIPHFHTVILVFHLTNTVFQNFFGSFLLHPITLF